MRRIKQFLFFLLFASLFIPPAFALIQESVFDGAVYPGNITTTANKLNFTVFISSDRLSALVKFSDRQFSVDNNSCSHDDMLNVCYKGTELGYYDVNKPDPAKGTSYTQIDKAKVSVYAITASMNISREIEKSTLWAGETTNVKTSIINIGDYKAENVLFYDNYTPSVEVYSSTCLFNSAKTYWEGSLDAGETKTCYYVLKAVSNTTYNSKADVKYERGNGNKTAETQATVIVKDYALQSSKDYRQSILTGEEVTMNVTLKATSDIAVFDYTLYLPSGLRLLKSNFTAVNFDNKTARFYGNLVNGSNISFYVRYRADYAGEYTIKEEASLRIQDIAFDQKLSRNLPLSISSTPLSITLNKDKLVAGKNSIAIFISNPSGDAYYEVEIKVSTNLSSMNNLSLSELSPAGGKDIVSEFDAAAGNYTIDVSAYYKSKNGQVLTTAKRLSVRVLPQNASNATAKAPVNSASPQASAPSSNQSPSEPQKITLEKIDKPSKSPPLKWMLIVPIAIVLILVLLVFILKKHGGEEGA